MKILYAVQKTGNGHLARAQEIIPLLEKYGDVTVLTSGSQSQIQLGYPVTYDFKGISLFYGSNGNVSFLKTLFKNNYAFLAFAFLGFSSVTDSSLLDALGASSLTIPLDCNKLYQFNTFLISEP